MLEEALDERDAALAPRQLRRHVLSCILSFLRAEHEAALQEEETEKARTTIFQTFLSVSAKAKIQKAKHKGHIF